MLVLSRKIDEKIIIQIDGEIIATITLIETRREKIRLGITAPAHVAILREELAATNEVATAWGSFPVGEEVSQAR